MEAGNHEKRCSDILAGWKRWKEGLVIGRGAGKGLVSADLLYGAAYPIDLQRYELPYGEYNGERAAHTYGDMREFANRLRVPHSILDAKRGDYSSRSTKEATEETISVEWSLRGDSKRRKSCRQLCSSSNPF